MSANLSLTNFQSWPQCHVEVKGFTTVLGESDLGKSSIFRAMKAVARNELVANHLRKGQNQVTLNLDGVELSRTLKGTPVYTVGDQKYEKLAGGTPLELKDLKMGEVEIGDFSFDPIFASQFDPQFGLSWTPTQLNLVLGAFSATDKLEKGKKELNRRVTEINSEAKTLAKEVTTLEAKLLQTSKLTVSAVDLQHQLTTTDAALRHAQVVSEGVQSWVKDREALDHLETLKSRLNIPTFTKIKLHRQILSVGEEVCHAQDALHHLQSTTKRLGKVPELPDRLGLLHKTQEVLQLLQRHQTLQSEVSAYQTKRQTIPPIKHVTPHTCDRIKLLEELIPLQRALSRESKVLSQLEVHAGAITKAAALSQDPKIQVCGLLRRLISLDLRPLPTLPQWKIPDTRVLQALERQLELVRELRGLDKEMQQLQTEYDAVMAELTPLIEEAHKTTCPNCGHKF